MPAKSLSLAESGGQGLDEWVSSMIGWDSSGILSLPPKRFGSDMERRGRETLFERQAMGKKARMQSSQSPSLGRAYQKGEKSRRVGIACLFRYKIKANATKTFQTTGPIYKSALN